ncbi:MAG: type II CRISPR RNA-guided endonuclease Cas9 [Candidatus Fimenecus sp.]
MQLLSEKFTFVELIDNENAKITKKIEKISYETIVDSLYVSPANKRAIWQAIQISEEIKKVMGCEPDKIFVEMARGGGEKNKRTKSRKEALKALYESCDEDVRTLANELERFEDRDFNNMKLYLYFTQMGKCIYTGEPIDLEELLQRNSKWDRDHIYPQSKIKDDSIDNLVLVKRIDNNNKGNGKIDTGIQNKMHNYWRSLLKKGFISQKKYDRLTRKSEFSNEELAGFINRQLVETRQSSKVVAELLKQLNENSQIVYVKAQLVSDFRKYPLNVLKSRRVNDYHHGKDAYLNIVVGNVYNAKFTSNPLNWFKKNKDTNYSINKVFNFDVKLGEDTVWEKFCEYTENGIKIAKGGTLETIRKIMLQNNLLYTEYTYCEKGALFNETLQRKGKKNVNIRLKANLDIAKYGGYESAKTSYFAQVEFDGKRGERVRNIISVPIYIANKLKHKPDAFKEYCADVKGMKNLMILLPKIKKNTLMVVNGFPMRIRGESGKDIIFKSAKQLHLTERDTEIIRKIEKYLEKNKGKQINEKIDKIYNEDLNYIYEILLGKLSTIYGKRPSNVSKLMKESQNRFNEMVDMSQKAEVIDQIVNFMRCDIKTTGNLEKIGGSKAQGSITVNTNTVCKNTVEIINQSVTGLFETRSKL